MTTYKAIQGYTVEKLSSDPSPDIAGKLFYNDTSNTFKIVAAGDAAWAVTNPLSSNRTDQASAGTSASTSMIMGGISDPPAGAIIALVETFDGTSWTEQTDLNTDKGQSFGGGTTTAAISAGGTPGGITQTELWNGVSWTVNPAVITSPSTYARGAAGTQASFLAFGGGGFVSNVEQWNGSTWTETTNLSTVRGQLGGSGADGTACLAMGGNTPRPPPPSATISAVVEEWNGTSWTTKTSMGNAGATITTMGTVTATLKAGGYPLNYQTELWNGTGWTENPNSNSAAQYRNTNGGGTQASGMMTGGTPAPVGSTSEEWALAPLAARTVTTS